MDPPEGLIYQSELPFERDAVQCIDGKWRYVRLRKGPVDVVAESSKKDDVVRIARQLSDKGFWEEHYEGMKLVDCVPPKSVFRDPGTCFLVVDGSPRPEKAPSHPESHVRVKKAVTSEPAPETPRSASWDDAERRTDWRAKIRVISKKIRGL